MAIKNYYENPPTAGLPVYWRDWLPTSVSLASRIAKLFALPPLSVTCSGTIALVIALNTLAKRYPQRPYVIIPAYTCPLVVLAIKQCGLKIILCDLAKDWFDFDLSQLATQVNEQILAVIPTHLGGRVADVAAVKKLTTPYNITVIEDAAQALGAEVGIHGDILFFSLAAGKGLTLYEGGLLTAKDPQLRQQLAEAAQQIPNSPGWELKRVIELAGYTALYHPLGLYFAYGIAKRKSLKRDDLIDAVGDYFELPLPTHRVSRFRQHVATNAASRLPDFLTATIVQANQRVAQLQTIAGIDVIIDSEGKQGTWPFLMVLLPSKIRRDRILQQLWMGPLGVSRLFIHALPNYPYLSHIVPQHSMANAEDFAQRMLTITNSLWLTDSEFAKILQTIRSVMLHE